MHQIPEVLLKSQQRGWPPKKAIRLIKADRTSPTVAPHGGAMETFSFEWLPFPTQVRQVTEAHQTQETIYMLVRDEHHAKRPHLHL